MGFYKLASSVNLYRFTHFHKITFVKQYSEPTELTAELLNNMINKIVVHEAVKYGNGFREQKIEIYYRFVGKID